MPVSKGLQGFVLLHPMIFPDLRLERKAYRFQTLNLFLAQIAFAKPDLLFCQPSPDMKAAFFFSWMHSHRWCNMVDSLRTHLAQIGQNLEIDLEEVQELDRLIGGTYLGAILDKATCW